MKTRDPPYMHLVAVYKEMKDLAKKKGKDLPVEVICRFKGDFQFLTDFHQGACISNSNL